MALSVEEIQPFSKLGYVAVPDFFTELETRALQADVRRLRSAGLFRNVATAGDGATEANDEENLQIVPLNPHSDLIRALAFHPKVIRHVSSLIGDRFVLHHDQIFLKPAGTGSGTNWHQDNAYFKINDPLKGTAIWIAVHDANAENGTLRVIPGMMHEQLEHDRDPDSNIHIRAHPTEQKAVTIELRAGGVVFFSYGTPHATGENRTDGDRAGIGLHFLHEDHTQDSERARSFGPVLAGPRVSGGELEYGRHIEDTWDREVRMLVGSKA